MISIWTAYILDVFLGDPYWFPHPVRLIGRLINVIEGFIRKIAKGDTALRIGGIFLTATIVTVTYGSSFLLLKLAMHFNAWLYHGINILLLYTCLASKCLGDEGKKIENVLARGDIELARKQVSYIVGRDTGHLDESGVTRATVETIAENTSDGVIAPLLYMMIGGAPLALAYKAINTLDSMVGYKNDKYLYLGWASARLDDVANFVPARLTGFLMVAAAFLLRLKGKESYRIMLRDSKNHSSPNSGWPEAAAAGALGVQLGGTNLYFGAPVYKPTIGNNERPLNREDINKTIKMMSLATVELLIIATVLFLR